MRRRARAALPRSLPSGADGTPPGGDRLGRRGRRGTRSSVAPFGAGRRPIEGCPCVPSATRLRPRMCGSVRWRRAQGPCGTSRRRSRIVTGTSAMRPRPIMASSAASPSGQTPGDASSAPALSPVCAAAIAVGPLGKLRVARRGVRGGERLVWLGPADRHEQDRLAKWLDRLVRRAGLDVGGAEQAHRVGVSPLDGQRLEEQVDRLVGLVLLQRDRPEAVVGGGEPRVDVGHLAGDGRASRPCCSRRQPRRGRPSARSARARPM